MMETTKGGRKALLRSCAPWPATKLGIACALQDGLIKSLIHDVDKAVEVLEAIRDYEPNEVAKDEFAYDRMVENYRDAARAGLGAH